MNKKNGLITLFNIINEVVDKKLIKVLNGWYNEIIDER